MASLLESVDLRCPSCKEPVQSKWKCCPNCETRLEGPSRQATTHINLPDCPNPDTDSKTDINEIDPQNTNSIDFGSACIEDQAQGEPPLVNTVNAIGSDCVKEPTQDEDIAVGSDSVEHLKQDADDDIGSDYLEITMKEYLRDFEEAVRTEYLRDFEEAVRTGGVANLGDFITDDLNKWRECTINIAVIGESGTGKSSFINAIRGLRPGDKFYAKTGSSETTTTLQQFPHPEHHNLVFWDLPGVGTQQFPKETYLSVIDVKKYDFFIVVSATRFKENDAWLAKEICHLEKKFYFVKAKIDVDVKNDLEDSDGTLTKTDIINNLRQHTIKELMQTGVTLPKLFLVNNRKIHEYDFKNLITQVINDLPDLKKDTMILSMSSLAIIILDEKRKLLQRRQWKSCIIASILNPIMGDWFEFDNGLLLHELKFYKEQFGTDGNSLKIIADRMNTPLDDFVQKLNIQSELIFRSNTDAFMSFLSMSYSSYREKSGSALESILLTLLPEAAGLIGVASERVSGFLRLPTYLSSTIKHVLRRGIESTFCVPKYA